MQNHELGIHSDKIWAESTAKNTLKYLTTYSADLPNLPKYLGYLKKTLIERHQSVAIATNTEIVKQLKALSNQPSYFWESIVVPYVEILS